MRILSADDVRRAVPMEAAIDAVAAAFAQLASGDAVVPLRGHIETPERAAISFFMPARIGGGPNQAALGIKVVSVFPHNQRDHAAPAIHALVTLLDPATGRPIAVLDGTYLTALRTGAASGVATRHMARADARNLAIFGAGAQALPQVLAVCAVREIAAVWIVNRDDARADRLAEQLRAAGFAGQIQRATAPAALAVADIICTATASAAPLFDDADLRPGTHINGVGSYKPTMAEVPPQTVARARLIVDQRVAAWAEAGDLVQARNTGLIGESHIVGELGAVVAGSIAGRTSDDEITFFKSVGNAVQDLAVAALALARAEEWGFGVEVAL